MEAYNEGIRNVRGDVIIFLDHDAIPKPDCVAEHLLTYDGLRVVGVSGDVIPAYLVNGVLKPLENSSEVANFYREPKILRIIGEKLWNRPLEGQEQYLAYISKAGYSQKNIYVERREINNSLPCMAANMSILRSALQNFRIPTSFLKRGIAFEQVIGWHSWKTGHHMVSNPTAKVYHIRHGQSMSRSLDTKNTLIAVIEDQLLFYYLLPREEGISEMHRIVSMMYDFLVHIKKTKQSSRHEMVALRGILFGNMIGLKWLVSRKVGGTYTPVHDPMLR